MRFQGFIGSSYQLVSPSVECQRSINLYPEVDEAKTEKDGGVAALIGTPGLGLITVVGNGPIRGMYVATNGVLYVMSGNTLFTLDANFNATSVGLIFSSSGPVSMVDNGVDLVLVDGPTGWHTALGSTTLTQITDPLFQGSNQVTILDGHFVFAKPSSNEFYISDLLSLTLDVLGFATRESVDPIVGFVSDHRNLWFFGENSSEVWFDTGQTTGMPFTVIQGSFMEVGCAAAFSIAQIANTIFFVGRDPRGQGVIYMTNGYSAQRISTHAVELAIQGYGDLSSATAYCYQENGHNFYCVNFPSAKTTWVYDVATGLWHERVYTYEGQFSRHRAESHVFYQNKHVVGDYKNANIYQLSSTLYTDNGQAITRQRIAPHISQDMARLYHSSFQLDMQPAVGIDGLGQGIAPQAMLQFSDDGGYNWSNEKWAGIGPIGKTKTRIIWRRLGHSRDRVYKITITDPVKVVLIGAELEVIGGAT